MHPRPHFLCLLSLAFSLTPVPLAAHERCLDQVWQGTIDRAAITMEFSSWSGDEKMRVGQYYYGHRLEELVLQPSTEQHGTWEERDAEGRLSGLLQLKCKANRLTGTWSSPDGKTVRRLNAVRAPSYRERQLSKLRFDVQEVIALGGGRTAEVIRVPGIDRASAVRIVGSGRGVEALNRRLLRQFREQLEGLLDCRVAGRHADGADDGYDVSFGTEVVAHSADLIVFRQFSSEACGGAHPAVDEWNWTWNIALDRPEDVSAWLTDEPPDLGEPDADGEYPETALASYIRTHSGEDTDECRDAVSVKLGPGELWPGPDGIYIRPQARSYAERYCAHEFLVPNDVIRPYMTEIGWKYLRAMKWARSR